MSNLKSKTIDFLSTLEGYHAALKMIHWSTKIKSEHLLTDDIDKSILDYEDKIAEVTMGLLNTRYGHGDLKCMLPEAKTSESLLKEMKSDVSAYRSEVEDSDDNAGIINILDDFITDIDTWKYLITFS